MHSIVHVYELCDVSMSCMCAHHQVRGRFEKELAFASITLESERLRLYKEFMAALEEQCTHAHHRSKKRKKERDRRRHSHSRSRSESVSLLSAVEMLFLLLGQQCVCTWCHFAE